MKQPVQKPEEKVRRTFDRTFKEEAVAMWASSSKSATLIARELGIDNPNLLYLWRKAFAPAAPGGKGAAGAKSPEELALEVQRLQKENDRLRTQRDILKKTLGILSEPPTSGMNGFKA
jgi:transposase